MKQGPEQDNGAKNTSIESEVCNLINGTKNIAF